VLLGPMGSSEGWAQVQVGGRIAAANAAAMLVRHERRCYVVMEAVAVAVVGGGVLVAGKIPVDVRQIAQKRMSRDVVEG
jgi:hypothetical protein